MVLDTGEASKQAVNQSQSRMSNKQDNINNCTGQGRSRRRSSGYAGDRLQERICRRYIAVDRQVRSQDSGLSPMATAAARSSCSKIQLFVIVLPWWRALAVKFLWGWRALAVKLWDRSEIVDSITWAAFQAAPWMPLDNRRQKLPVVCPYTHIHTYTRPVYRQRN